MAKHQILYVVFVRRGMGADMTTLKVYQSTKRGNAEKFLHQYLREHEAEVDIAYIESKYLSNGIDKRDSSRWDD